jgi:hypothetical protein
MSRTAVALVILAALLGAAALAWWWWAAPPLAPASSLAAASRLAAADADGVAVIASPARATRWLVRHPQALALLAVAAPGAVATAPRLRPLAAALVEAARGPLVVWWKGADIGLAASVSDGAQLALTRLAAFQSLPLRRLDGAVSVATRPELLAGRPAPAWPQVPAGRLSALVRCGDLRWQARAGWSSLDVQSGSAPALPGLASPSAVATSRLGAWLGALNLPAELPPQPAVLVFAAAQGAAIHLPDAELPGVLRDIIERQPLPPSPQAPPGATHWRSTFGELWIVEDGGLEIATSPALLARLSGALPSGEAGQVAGADLAWTLGRLAEIARQLPFVDQAAADLQRAAQLSAGLRAARWRVTASGGAIRLEW